MTDGVGGRRRQAEGGEETGRGKGGDRQGVLLQDVTSPQ